ncbi:hypothetical protein NA57DRAFT_80507 [Rhizodiscina lignyota]|uniref:Uncharacterized protein n=1 Tax=Rhizodiscina lignyota TaxID=1504668 RepID=A0A9P4I6Z8_9PEZI|nr:hypothetical protein NA57DRAFT_80507 [Rhizodiscina lignyota]
MGSPEREARPHISPGPPNEACRAFAVVANSTPYYDVRDNERDEEYDSALTTIARTFAPKLFCQVCLIDPNLAGLAVRFRSSAYMVGARELVLGDCTFVSAPIEPLNGCHLRTERTDHGMLRFALEYLIPVCEVMTGKHSFTVAGQVDVSETVYGIVSAQLDRGVARYLAEEGAHTRPCDDLQSLRGTNTAQSPSFDWLGSGREGQQGVPIEPDFEYSAGTLQAFGRFAKILQSHHTRCFVLKPYLGQIQGLFVQDVVYASQSLLAARSELGVALSAHSDILRKLNQLLVHGKRVRIKAKWGTEQDDVWIYCTPVGEGLSGEVADYWWVCFVIDSGEERLW